LLKFTPINPLAIMKKSTIPVTYGLAIAAGLIIYFLFLSLLGLHTKPYMSILNAVIAGTGIYLALKNYKLYKGSHFKYQKGFMAGILTGFNATIVFTIFIALYASTFNPDFLSNMEWRLTGETGLTIFLFEVAIMGFATSLVLTLSFMQLFKDSWNTPDGNRHTFNDKEKK